MVDMTSPSPPNLACFSSFDALYQADMRDVAAAVLWVSCAHKLGSPVPTFALSEIQSQLKGTIPELAYGFWRKGPPRAISAQHVMLEGIQILMLNRLLLFNSRHTARRWRRSR
jgi:hypothetical protein